MSDDTNLNDSCILLPYFPDNPQVVVQRVEAEISDRDIERIAEAVVRKLREVDADE